MNILAIDTSAAACSIALLKGKEIFAVHEITPMQQAQLILPKIDALLKTQQMTLQQLDALAFGCGPGSFTGLRIAVSVAQGLGYAASLPLIPISSLAALAQATYQELGWEKLLVAVDARVNEIYWACYTLSTTGLVELIGKESLCAPENIVCPVDNTWCGVGNGWQIYRDKLPFRPTHIDTERLPMAFALAKLAEAKALQGEWITATAATPIYLRDDVVTK